MNKTLLILMILGLFAVIGCTVRDDIIEPADLPVEPPVTSIQLSEVEKCEEAGGTWRLFNNGCRDICSDATICTQAITAGCDCGPTQCYDQGLTAQNICCRGPTYDVEGAARATLFWSSPEACPSPTDASECADIEKTIKCVSDPNEPYPTSEAACEATSGNWSIKIPTSCTTDEECQQDSSIDGCFKFVGDLGTMIGCNRVGRVLEPPICPQFIQTLCEDGKLVSDGFAETGCRKPAKCIRPTCQCPDGQYFISRKGCSETAPAILRINSVIGGLLGG